MTEPTLPRQSAVVLVNRAAGNGRGAVCDEVVALLRSRGLDVQMVMGDSRDDAEAALRRAAQARPDVIVSVGGDGTHGVALQAACAADIPLALITAGTGNDAARALGLPRKDLQRAVDAAVAEPAQSYDVARVRTRTTERLVFTIVTAGFDSLVSDRTNAMTWPRGRARYVVAIGAEYARLRSRPFRVVVDGAIVHDGPAILCAAANTTSYGGGMRIATDADPRDGMLDLTIIGDVAHPRLELPKVLPRVFRGTHTTHPAVTTLRGREIEIDCPDMGAYADGDPVGPLPAQVTALPGAVRIIAPR